MYDILSTAGLVGDDYTLKLIFHLIFFLTLGLLKNSGGDFLTINARFHFVNVKKTFVRVLGSTTSPPESDSLK